MVSRNAFHKPQDWPLGNVKNDSTQRSQLYHQFTNWSKQGAEQPLKPLGIAAYSDKI